jgi:hypothetical protein
LRETLCSDSFALSGHIRWRIDGIRYRASGRTKIFDDAAHDSSFHGGKQGETRDVSFRGLYFVMEAIVEAGSPIEFVLTLPQQITLAGDVHIRCYARVLRVEEQMGRRGVAARIERYEFLPATA